MSVQIIDIKLDDFISENQCRKARERGKYLWGKSGLLIGRDTSHCDLPIDCQFVSRKHAHITYLGSRFFIEDSGSTDGTRLNGQPLQEKRMYSLLDKDEVCIGDRTIRVQIPGFGTLDETDDTPVSEPAPRSLTDEIFSEEDELESLLAINREAKNQTAPTEQDLSGTANPSASSVRTKPDLVAPQTDTDDEFAETMITSADALSNSPDPKLLVRSFVEGLKIDTSATLGQIKDEVTFMRSMGGLLYHSIDGIRKALQTQDRFMDQYRIPGTVLGRSHVNPLYTHNIETADAIEIMLTNSVAAIADPITAVQEATRDFYRHGIAVPSGVDAAIKRIMQTFDWAEIEKNVRAAGGLGAVGPLKKASYWDWFCREYDRYYATLDEFDNEFRRAVGTAYANARNQISQHANQGVQHGE